MTAYEIPLSSGPQDFDITLGTVSYRFSLRWCEPGGFWSVDLRLQSGEKVVCGLPLVPGCDLLKQLAHLGIGGALFVQTQGDARLIPGYDDLGENGLLFFVVP